MNQFEIYRIARGGYWVSWEQCGWFEVTRDVYANYSAGLRPACCDGMEDNTDRSILFWCAVLSVSFSSFIAAFVFGVMP